MSPHRTEEDYIQSAHHHFVVARLGPPRYCKAHVMLLPDLILHLDVAKKKRDAEDEERRKHGSPFPPNAIFPDPNDVRKLKPPPCPEPRSGP